MKDTTPSLVTFLPSTMRSMNKASLQKIDVWQQKVIADENIANSHVIVYRDGKICYDNAFGQQRGNGKPNNKNTIYRLYSMTKPIVSLALMMLFEEGKLLLSDPVHLYLGETWKKKNMSVYKSGSFKKGWKTSTLTNTVTIKHLLTHTSGISYAFDPLGLVSKVDEILHRGKFTPQGSKLPLVEWAKNVSKAPLAFNPGDHYLYGLNTDVVGALVEVISGQPLDEFLHERIFQPLGMVDTSFWVPEEKYDRFSSLWMPADAAAYMAATSPSSSATATATATKKKKNVSKLKEIDFQWSPDAATRKMTPRFINSVHTKPVFLSGGGGLCGTAMDYAKFCEMLLHGGRAPTSGQRVVSSKTIQFMSMNHLTKNDVETDMSGMSIPGYSELTSTAGVGFGLGFSVVASNALTKQIDSVGTYSWGGAASTTFICDPKENLFVVHMTSLRFRNDMKTPLKMQLLQHVYASIDDDLSALNMRSRI